MKALYEVDELVLRYNRVFAELDLEFRNISKGNLNKPWKNREVFCCISDAGGLEIAFVNALKEQP